MIDYHEEGVWRLNEALEFVLPLLKLRWWVQQIDIILKNLKIDDHKTKKKKKNYGAFKGANPQTTVADENK